MNCRRAKKLVFNFVDGMIDDRDRLALESHLGECPTCEAMAASLTKSLDLLHRLPPAQLDDNFNWKVRLRLAREKNAAARAGDTRYTWARSWNRRFAFSALSTFVVAIAIGYLVMNGSVVPADFASRPVATALDETKVAGEKQEKSVDAPAEAVARGGRANVPNTPVRSRVVSSGDDLAGGIDNGPMKADPGPILDTDSLTIQFLKSAATNYRVRQLQHQIEMLQIELRECEIDTK